MSKNVKNSSISSYVHKLFKSHKPFSFNSFIIILHIYLDDIYKALIIYVTKDLLHQLNNSVFCLTKIKAKYAICAKIA